MFKPIEKNRAKGNLCPNCGSHDIEGEAVDITQDGARQDCSCSDCESEWVCYYKFESFQYYRMQEVENA